MKTCDCWLVLALAFICMCTAAPPDAQVDPWQFGHLTSYPLKTSFQNPCESLNPDIAIVCDQLNNQPGQYRYDQLQPLYLMVPSWTPPVAPTPSGEHSAPPPAHFQSAPINYVDLSLQVNEVKNSAMRTYIRIWMSVGVVLSVASNLLSRILN